MRHRTSSPPGAHRPMFCLLLLLVPLLLSGCGEAGERFREGYRASAQGVSVPQMRMQQAQADLLQLEVQQQQRHHRAEANLPRFRQVLVPSLTPIATDLLTAKQAMDAAYQPGPELIEEAASRYNQAHPQTPITPTDLDTFYLTEQGRMAFWSLKIVPRRSPP